MSVKRKLVLPGEEVAMPEEFMVEGSSYLDSVFRSSALGYVVYDSLSHTAVVKPFKRDSYPRQGDILYCVVTSKGVRALNVRCVAREMKEGFEELKYPVTGLIPPQLVDGKVGIGDYVRARVVSNYGPPFLLSIRGSTFGVVRAVCPKCGNVMRRRGGILVCPVCGATAVRKIAHGFYV
ncbi:exosome complex RNA-binding protein Csl4 [Thermoproteus tenax]|uniref:Exosome complex component Csl4 n=1 Tax=Thermoproteus tenax (strain ATCC 35583 / DSM 2078 / JCM 9277 / NBRC 100435 / Kra 1) TaxID=768679 RepID=G4RLB5_THETK|nr:exosome complex RNA-binding protein Csl4 [Thermoproteus tenax]CCC82360.1 RNA-binding protein, S1 and Zn-ribbon domains [Thermoproteus tenax Kra 1]